MLLRPKYRFQRITEIPVSFFTEHSFQTVLLDVDNTLTTYHGTEPIEGLETWLQNLKKNGLTVVIVSNSKEQQIRPFAEKLGLPFVAPGLKPLSHGYRKARKKYAFQKKKTVTIGDQLFTDILGGNLYGISTVLVTPILLETQRSYRIKRWLENRILRKMKWE